MVISLIATAKATVFALALSREQVMTIRAVDLEISKYLPADDIMVLLSGK